MKVTGSVSDAQTTVIDGKEMTILADPGASIACTTASTTVVLQVQGAANVSIYDLQITGGSGPETTNGAVSLIAVGGTPTVTMTRVTVTGAKNSYGIFSANGNLVLSHCSVTSNFTGGISADEGSLVVDQSTVADNNLAGGGTGISVSTARVTVSQSQIFGNGEGVGVVNSPMFSITNNFIYRNGNTNLSPGGVFLQTPEFGSVFAFNTVVDNVASSLSTSAGGIVCDEASFVAANNLIFGNTGGMSGNVQTRGACTWGNSLIRAAAGPDDNSLGFVRRSTAPFDYHLSAASPSSVVDAAGSCTGIDIDGETRPIGVACDLGADEFDPSGTANGREDAGSQVLGTISLPAAASP